METNSFFARIAKNKLVFIFLIIVLVSSIISNYLLGYYIISEFTPDYTIKAIELDEKPTKFVPYSQIDTYNIQTIFDDNSSVKISLMIFLEINELMVKNYRTSNVQYGDSYYRLSFSPEVEPDKVVPWSFIVLSYVIIAISFISGFLIVVIIIEKIMLYFMKR